MGIADQPLSRRSALLAGATLVGGLGYGSVAQAASAADTGRNRSDRGHPGHGRHLSLRQQAGQRVILSYPGPTPPTSLIDMIGVGEVGGVIFFGENITSLDQITGVVADLKAANADSPVKAPLLLMTDQEGGLIRRIKPGEPVLSEKQIGASADPTAAAHDAGLGAALTLAGVGMNNNLAPVLDVFREAGNFDDQFQRSYSSDRPCAPPAGQRSSPRSRDGA